MTATPITSSRNAALSELRRLHRRRARQRAGRFVAEGEDLLAAADAAGWVALERYCAAGSGLAGREVEPAALAAASALGSGTRALAVFAQRPAIPVGPICVGLWGVADPGNVGTVLRSAHAFGAASVALGPGCADPYGPKAVRASMGAIFRVPVAPVQELDALPVPRIALAPGRGAALHGPLGPGEQATLLIGAEREGLPEEIVASCEGTAHIPMGAGNSLNAAMAATVGLYELTRPAPARDNRIAP